MEHADTRREWLTRCGAVTTGLSLIGGCLDDVGTPVGNGSDDASTSDDWRMYGGDLQHTGYRSGMQGPTGDSVEAEPMVEFEQPGESGPTLVDGTLYFNTGDGYVYAIDLESGEQVWRYDLENAGYWGPTVHDGVVYTTFQHKLFAIDAAEGELIWEREVLSSSVRGRLYSPRPTDDGLIVQGGNELHRVEYEAGDVTSLAELDDGWTNSLSAVPAIDDDAAYLASDETVYAIDLATGDVRWEFQNEEAIDLRDYDPVVVDGTVFVGPYALDIANGSKRWELEAGTPHNPSPSVDGEHAYYNVAGTWLAADVTTGETEWTVDVNPDPRGAKPVVTDDLVYFCRGLDLAAIETDSGTVRWEYYTDDVDISFWNPFVVSDGALYALSSGGTCYAFTSPTEE
ncbi:PQQ-binding-like beta-propeller repeat protein [Halopiger goleimassiliensis]|uniref:PQQ-binding-like beta-propeller repeat protein n=1 Tax=Halopiger goleimassiliensis TaxID=1293048 RepID=UPI000677C334|nr:PQQ-binding-like beta-propeller repeat protein [Halopiger goleimassiliensis]